MTADNSGTDGMPPGQLATVVHLVRHGEVANPDGILYGRIPGFKLSEDGQMMAKAAADFMAGPDDNLLQVWPPRPAGHNAPPDRPPPRPAAAVGGPPDRPGEPVRAE